jgi:hypothetical protein
VAGVHGWATGRSAHRILGIEAVVGEERERGCKVRSRRMAGRADSRVSSSTQRRHTGRLTHKSCSAGSYPPPGAGWRSRSARRPSSGRGTRCTRAAAPAGQSPPRSPAARGGAVIFYAPRQGAAGQSKPGCKGWPRTCGSCSRDESEYESNPRGGKSRAPRQGTGQGPRTRSHGSCVAFSPNMLVNLV